MPSKTTPGKTSKIGAAQIILRELGFAERQRNELASLVLLALADLKPRQNWTLAAAPLRGITPIIAFIAENYGVIYAPNTRETIRDEAVKFFAESGLLLRNPDSPSRPTNSGKTVYQLEPSALALLRSYGQPTWPAQLAAYLKARTSIRAEILRDRTLARVPVVLPDGSSLALSPGGQNPLIKSVIEEFCPRFTPNAVVAYVGDAESKFLHLDSAYLATLGLTLAPSAKMPDIVVHDRKRNWLILIEAVMSAGPVDGKRRSELKQLFKNPPPASSSSPPSKPAPPCKNSSARSRGNPKSGSPTPPTTSFTSTANASSVPTPTPCPARKAFKTPLTHPPHTSAPSCRAAPPPRPSRSTPDPRPITPAASSPGA